MHRTIRHILNCMIGLLIISTLDNGYLYPMLSHIVQKKIGKLENKDFSHKNIIAVLNSLGFVKFADLIEKAKLTNYFIDAQDITLFVPTNEAIAKFLSMLSHEDKKVFKKHLPQLIKFHMIHTAHEIENLQKKPMRDTYTPEIKLLMKGGAFYIAPTKDPQQFTHITITDIKTKNGIIQIIDNILIPPEIPIKKPY